MCYIFEQEKNMLHLRVEWSWTRTELVVKSIVKLIEVGDVETQDRLRELLLRQV